MSETKCMPGPWEVDPTTEWVSVRRVGPLPQGARYRVCGVGAMRGDDIEKATAALIAAAPDMLSVLRDIEWNGDDRHPTCPMCAARRTQGHDADCKLAAAIAKTEARP